MLHRAVTACRSKRRQFARNKQARAWFSHARAFLPLIIFQIVNKFTKGPRP
jgi:hypothetical protein